MAPVNATDMVLLPEGLRALKKVATEVGLDLRGAYLNLDGGFDSARNRKCIFNREIPRSLLRLGFAVHRYMNVILSFISSTYEKPPKDTSRNACIYVDGINLLYAPLLPPVA